MWWSISFYESYNLKRETDKFPTIGLTVHADDTSAFELGNKNLKPQDAGTELEIGSKDFTILPTLN